MSWSTVWKAFWQSTNIHKQNFHCLVALILLLSCNTLILSLSCKEVWLSVFNINGKTPQNREMLRSSVNWGETSLKNNLRILVVILFGPIAFEGLREIIIYSTSMSSGELQKKRIYISWREKIMTIIFKVFNRRLNVSRNIHKIFVKSIGYILWFR